VRSCRARRVYYTTSPENETDIERVKGGPEADGGGGGGEKDCAAAGCRAAGKGA